MASYNKPVNHISPMRLSLVYRFALISILCLFTRHPAIAQHAYNVLGTWEGNFTDDPIQGKVAGNCRLTLTRFDDKIIEGTFETYDLANGQKGTRKVFRAGTAYINGEFYLLQRYEATDYFSKNLCEGTYMWKLAGDSKGYRVLSGTFESEDESCGKGLPTYRLQFVGDDVAQPWNIAGFTNVNVDYVDATELSDFKQGFAIIRKGENFAMINKNGVEVIPYGRYKFNQRRNYNIDTEKCGFSNGMCVVRDPVTEMYGYINLKGELVIPCTLKDAEPFMEDGYGLALMEEKTGQECRYYYNKNGTRFDVLPPWSIYLNRYSYFYPGLSVGGKTTFYNKEGKRLFTTNRKTGDAFGDGMIRVDTTMKMAGDKIGFLDTTGKLVIPYHFKAGRIAAFSEGLALYEPSVRDEFSYIFINKKGEPELRIRNTEQFPDIHFSTGHMDKRGLFSKGYIWGTSAGKPFLMNKEGEINLLSNLINVRNASYVKRFKKFDINFEDRKQNMAPAAFIFEGMVHFDVPHKFITGGFGGGKVVTNMRQETYKGMGLAHLSGEFILPPVYSEVGFMDEVSGLARAVIKRGGQFETLVEGYVDKTGSFVLIKRAMNNE